MSQLLLGVGRGVAAVAAGGAFAPNSDPTATHWWDASYAAGVTGSAGTFSIADRIGSAPLITTNTNEPGTSKTINGNTAYVFDGTDRMWTAGIADLSSDTFHLFMVGEIGVIDSTADAIVSVGDVIASSADQIRLSSNGVSDFPGRVTCLNIGASSFNLTGGPYTGVKLLELVVNVSTGAIEAFVGGTSRGTGTGYTGFTTATPSIMIFSSGSGLNEMGGSFCEMVVCNTPRTGSDATAMRTYLNTKWGL